MTSWRPPKANQPTTALLRTVRCMNIFGGIPASSCSCRCHRQNTGVKTAKPHNNPTTVAELHLYFSPPHWRARRSMITVGTNKTKPGRSRCLNFSINGNLVAARMVGWKKTSKRTSVTAPHGRLIQKPCSKLARVCEYQLAFSVRTPSPGKMLCEGSAQDWTYDISESKHGADNSCIHYRYSISPYSQIADGLISLGRSLKGIVWAMMTSAPENSPAAPRPATVLPIIRTTEEGEVAQIRLPISNTPRNVRKAHFNEKCW